MRNVVTSNPKIMHGVPCFEGTRVPVRSLFDHLEAGHTVTYFVEQFQSVRRAQVQAVLEESKLAAEACAIAVNNHEACDSRTLLVD